MLEREKNKMQNVKANEVEQAKGRREKLSLFCHGIAWSYFKIISSLLP